MNIEQEFPIPARSAGRGVTAAQRRVLERMMAGEELTFWNAYRRRALVFRFALGGEQISASTGNALVDRGWIRTLTDGGPVVYLEITDLGRAAVTPAVGGGDAG